MDQPRAKYSWAMASAIVLVTLGVLLLVSKTSLMKLLFPTNTSTEPNETQPTTDAATGTPEVTTGALPAGNPVPLNWQTYRVSDPGNPRFAYGVSVPAGYKAAFREYGYDVEVSNPAGETVMLVSRYRGPDNQLKINVEGFKVVNVQAFNDGPYPAQRFILETPPELFNPNAPVWWNNSRRQEVHMPVPSMGFVFVFTAASKVPENVFTTFAASLRLTQ